mmetsp:Transcript_16089/g.26276  ORF Transcript_16089/g.26276 Transcript_16089/m.26276 type:complete len:271 (+) Transcript_16089:489-1301(+)
MLVLTVDFATYGFSTGETSRFVIWWDMVGTVSYVRGRHKIYTLQKHVKSGGDVLWKLYVVMNSYLFYVIAGRTCRCVMRGTLVLPTTADFGQFLLAGLLPIHFSDRLFDLLERNDMHQLVMCAFWALTKTRSVYQIVLEAIALHKYSFPAVILLCIVSCEIASVMSKLELYVLFSRASDGSFMKEVFSSTVYTTILVGVCTYVAAFADSPRLKLACCLIGYCACFVRYGGSLLEKKLFLYFKTPRVFARDFPSPTEKSIPVLGISVRRRS